ncbi:MAG: DUF389 domain-containing protein [Alphaproteobacteria bacterium]|nr:DUF389 domain-containing protein [Alphaproteobacteria bacterium]
MSGLSLPAIRRMASRATLIRILAVLNRWRKLPFKTIDHDAVMEHLAKEGGISASYCVLTALSCGIAILGLLLSSPAVVIGAMLISPLMSPIILFGFSLATLDEQLAIKSLKAIVLGTGLAITQAAVIVWMSPLNSATAEILARTRPNFFDLLVAIFSAIAGAYAVANRKGETIVGVAIATALMPPLAVIGYGLAVHNWAITTGASGLFMTNLLAIALTASLVARFFGFGSMHPSRTGLWHTLGIFAVFGILSIPLGFSLEQIAREAVLTSRAKNTLNAYFEPYNDHIYGMDIKFAKDQPIQINALVLTQKNRIGADAEMQKRLQQALGRPVQLSLSQVPVHAHESLDRQAVEALVSESAAMLSKRMQNASQPDIAAIAAAEAQVPLLDISLDRQGRTVLIRGQSDTAAELAAMHHAATVLRQRFADWRFDFHPDVNALPPIPFTEDSTQLDPAAEKQLSDMIWALKSAGVNAVRAIGRADTQGKSAVANRHAALRRAIAVSTILQQAGIKATAVAQYLAPRQRAEEAENGRAAFRQVLLEPQGD